MLKPSASAPRLVRRWFAALGSYQHNPWLLHLVYKILLGQANGSAHGVAHGAGGGGDAVLPLLDLDAYPFTSAPPARVRLTLFHYDFTRARSEWARRIPGAALLPANCSALLGPFAGGRGCDRWWKRRKVREYLPPVDRRVLEEQVVAQQGWPVGGGVPTATAASSCRVAAAARGGAGRDALLPVRLCQAVVGLVQASARLRRKVSVDLPVGGGRALSVDAPLITILVAVAMPLLLRGGVSIAVACARAIMRRTRSGSLTQGPRPPGVACS